MYHLVVIKTSPNKITKVEIEKVLVKTASLEIQRQILS